MTAPGWEVRAFEWLHGVPADRRDRDAWAGDARERDARAAWCCMPPRLRVRFCQYAGRDAAADLSFSQLTDDDRAALAAAAKHADFLGSFAWGLLQLVPE